MAEYGWGLSPQLVEKARQELHEDPERTNECLDLVREQIVTRPDISKLNPFVTWVSPLSF